MRDRASYAFALVSVAAALEVEDGTRHATCGSRSAASRTSRGAPGAAEAVLRGERAGEATFRAAAEAELADGTAARDNGFKVELARRTIVAVLGQLAGPAA